MKYGPTDRTELVTQVREHRQRIQQDLLDVVRPSTVDLLEIGAPENSSLKRAMEHAGGSAFSMGLWNQFDFARPAAVKKAREYVQQHRPRRVHLSPPCTPFSIIQAVNQRSAEQRASLQKKRTWGTRVMNHMIEVGLYALSLGCEISFEHPANATSWNSVAALRELRRQLVEVTVAGCAWGMTDPETGDAVYKNWRFLVSSSSAADAIERKCPRDHRHRQLDGQKRVGESAKYPPNLSEAMCRDVLASALVAGVAADVPHYADVLEELWAHGSAEPTYTATEEEEQIDEPTAELRESVLLKLHRLHSQLGHPGNKAFSEFLRRRRAPRWIQQESAQLKCAACARFQKHKWGCVQEAAK